MAVQPLFSPRNGAVATFDEIAYELGVTPQRAKQIYDRALCKLRRRLRTPIFQALAAQAGELERMRELRQRED